MAENEDNFTMDLTGDYMATVTPNVGGAFKKVPWGNYKVRLIATKQKPKAGDKPHVMLLATFVIVAAHEPANAHAVGMTIEGLYAGSKQSPKFMQQRLANLIVAAKVQLTAGQALSSSMLVGREMDATITWELSKPVFDQTTGAQKQYVNERLIAERPVGAPMPEGINPEADSAEAIKFHNGGHADAPAATGTPDMWAAPEAGAQAGAAQAQTVATMPDVQTGFRSEDQADAMVHMYRAYVALKTPYADQARAGLVQSGFDPDGPIDAGQLTDANLKAQYIAAFPTAPAVVPAGGLPGLPGLPPAGGKAKTGTRSKA